MSKDNLIQKQGEQFIICPICGAEAPYESIKGDRVEETHIWVCGECPFVGYEYYNERDTERLNDRLEKGTTEKEEDNG